MRKYHAGWLLLAGLAVLVSPAVAHSADAGGLRLIAQTASTTYDQFVVAGNRVAVRRGGGTETVPADAVWHLEGDLRAAGDLFWFAPEYEVVTAVANESPETEPVLRHALIRLRGRTAWNNGTLRGGIVVVVWLVDGRAVEVVPAVARAHDDESIGLVAAVAVPLSAAAARGAPAVMLWKGNRFIPPRTWFKEATADAALADLFLGSAGQAAASLRLVKNVNVRPELPADERPRRVNIIPGEVGALFARRDAEENLTPLGEDALFSLSDFALEADRTPMQSPDWRCCRVTSRH